MRQGLVSTLLLAPLLTACATDPWDAALADAARAEPFEVRTDLNAIRDGNASLVWRDAKRRQLLVATVESAARFERYWSEERGQTPRRPLMWVTLAPELERACRAFEGSGDALANRVAAYLGLPPGEALERVVLLWVDRDRLLRPCPDPETDDDRCRTGAPDPALRIPGLDETWAELFAELEADAYPRGAPWTRLGYTYDYGSPLDHQGASEYVMMPGTDWLREDAPGLEAYCEARPGS